MEYRLEPGFLSLDVRVPRAFRGDFAALAASLVPPISPQDSRKSVKLLLDLGLAEQDGDELKVTAAAITTGRKATALQVDLVHRQTMRKAALVAQLEIPGGIAPDRRAALEATGALSGTITDSANVSNGLVYVPGTPFFAEGDGNMRYSLVGLPTGNHPIVKAWTRLPPSDSAAPCGGLEIRKDTAMVRITPGEKAVW